MTNHEKTIKRDGHQYQLQRLASNGVDVEDELGNRARIFYRRYRTMFQVEADSGTVSVETLELAVDAAVRLLTEVRMAQSRKDFDSQVAAFFSSD